MLAERTQEHLVLFEDGVEAVFFDSNDELLDMTRFYVKYPTVASKIGQAGRERCLRSGYSNHHRAQQMLEIVWRL
jgi:spore maturation protein CgeB